MRNKIDINAILWYNCFAENKKQEVIYVWHYYITGSRW